MTINHHQPCSNKLMFQIHLKTTYIITCDKHITSNNLKNHQPNFRTKAVWCCLYPHAPTCDVWLLIFAPRFCSPWLAIMVATNLKGFPWLKPGGFFGPVKPHETKMKPHETVKICPDCWILLNGLRDQGTLPWFCYVMLGFRITHKLGRKPSGRCLKMQACNEL